ncbi:AEC family transporter [Agrobacterium vitis]
MYVVTGLASELAVRMLPAYAAIAIGFSVGRLSREDWLKRVSSLLMYVLIPVVVFKNTASLSFDKALIGIGISIAFSVTMVALAVLILPYIRTSVPRRLAYCSFGYTNIGWFGIPIGLALFGPTSLPFLVMAYVGGLLFGNTIGFYLVARDRFSVRESVKKVAMLPAIHAFAAGVLFQALHANPNLITYFESPFQLATILMSACGMMVVGIGASHVAFSWAVIRGTITLVVCRHILAICAIGIVVWMSAAIGAPIKPESLNAVILIGLLPVAGNLVVFASQLGSGVASASLIIAISTTISTLTVFGWGLTLG